MWNRRLVGRDFPRNTSHCLIKRLLLLTTGRITNSIWTFIFNKVDHIFHSESLYMGNWYYPHIIRPKSLKIICVWWKLTFLLFSIISLIKYIDVSRCGGRKRITSTVKRIYISTFDFALVPNMFKLIASKFILILTKI